MAEALLQRVYDIKIAGYDDSIKSVNALTIAFNKMDDAKKKLNTSLQQKLDAGDTSAIQLLTDQIKKLEVEMQNVSQKREASAKESALLAKAEKDLAAAEAIRTKSIIDQEKELDRQIALEQKQGQVAAKNSNDAKAQAGNYYALLKAQKEAVELYKVTLDTSPNFNQVKDNAVAATKLVNDRNRALSPDGTLVGEYSTGIMNAYGKLGLGDVFKKQKDDINGQLKQLYEQSKTLAQQLKNIGTTGGESFGKIDTQLRENILHQESLKNSLHNIESAYIQTGGIGTQITQGIADSFKNLKGQLAQVVIGYVGFQAVISGTQSIIHQNYELSDSVSQLQIYLKGSKTDADNLVESLKKLDTRTSLAGLVDIATIIAKKGVAKEEITGITQAVDNLMIALGKEIGDPHEAVGTLVKLVNVYSEDKHVSADNINRIGGAIAKLSTSGVATGKFLIEFSESMAGIRGITGLTINDVLGLGAGLEELAQKSNVSSSALSQVVVKMFTNSEKVAKAIGMTTESFKKMLHDNPLETVLTVAQKLKGSGDLASMDDFFGTMKEFGKQGKGIVGVLGDLGTNADYARKRMNDAKNAMNEQGIVAGMAALKQHNFAATLDRISKSFEILGANTTFQSVLLAIATAISFVLANMTPLIGAIGLYSTIWTIANATLIKTRIVTLASNIAFEAQFAWLTITQTATKAYTVAMELLTGVTEGAAAATTLFGLAMEFLPLGIILTVVGVLGAAFVAFGSKVAGTTDALRKNAIQTKIDNDIRDKAKESIGNQITQLETLAAVVLSTNSSYDTSKLALEELIKKHGRFSDALKVNYIDLIELKKILGEVEEEIKLNANAQAAASLTADKYKDYLQLVSLRQKIETASVGVNDKNANIGFSSKWSGNSKISDEESDILRSLNNIDYTRFLTGGGAVTFKAGDFDKIKKELQAKEKAALDIYEQYQGTAAKYQGDIYKKQAEKEAKKPSVFERFKVLAENGGTDTEFEALLKDVKAKREKANRLSKEYAELKELELKIQELMNPKNKKASSISGEDTDEFRKIDRDRDIKLTSRETEMLTQKQINKLSYDDEVKYIKDIAAINEMALQQKIDYLTNKTKLNVDEKLKLAEFGKQKVDIEIKTLDQIEALNKKEFEKGSKKAENNLKDQNRVANDGYNKIETDPDKSNTQKLAAKQNLNFQLLANETDYLHKIQELEKKYGIESIDTEEKIADTIKKLTTSIHDTKEQEAQAEINDIEAKGKAKIALTQDLFNKIRMTVLNSSKSADEKTNLFTDIDKNEKFATLQLEVDTLEKELPIYAKLLSQKKITDEEYEKHYTEYVTKIKDLQASMKQVEVDKINDSLFKNITSTKDLLKAGISKTFSNKLVVNKDDSEKEIQIKIKRQQLLTDTISEAYQLSQNAMNTFYDNERTRIENSLKLKERQIDAEKRVALGHAQSAAEQDTIERQAAAKKLAAEKQAFEENKKIQKAQAGVNLAEQLSNLAVIAFAPNPMNIATLGAAGAVMYAIQAAIAVANYGMNVSKINAAQFATGGKVIPLDNGKIVANQNIPSQANGDNILATVRRGEVILNERQQRALGGDQTFRAIGVPGFGSGGFTGLGDFRLGDNLMPPYNPSSFLNRNKGSNDYTELKSMLEGTIVSINSLAQQTNKRIDNIQVTVSAGKVDRQIQKDHKFAKIASL